MSAATLTPEERVRLELGPEYGVAKVSGYYVIGRTSPRWERVSPEPLRTSLARAIEDARREIAA